MNSEFEQQVVTFLAAHHVLSLATAGPDGAHAANLFYACDGLALIWVSDTTARHSRHIDADPRVAATIAGDHTTFATIRGLQIAGHAQKIVPEDARARHLKLMEDRYPFLRKLEGGSAKLRDAYARTAIYRLQPTRITLIDNTKGFGHKETLEMPG